MEEIIARGMILAAAPQGEYGRRLTVLTDRLGKITVFASGAAKAGSRLMGKIRPFTAAELKLAKGRGAYNIHGAEVIDAFEELPLDPDIAMYGFYVLELADFFSVEGMEETEAKELLNLSFMALSALREKELRPELIVSLLKLRLLKLHGEYTETPPLIFASGQKDVIIRENNNAGAEGTCSADTLTAQWRSVLSAPISKLFNAKTLTKTDTAELEKNIEHLFKKQIPHKFKTARLIGDL